MKRQGLDSIPKGFCEYRLASGAISQYHFPVTQATHTYEWRKTSGTLWYCSVDGVTKLVTTGMPFGGGTYLNAQGETNSQDSQIGGYPPPNGILFSSMQYQNGIGTWFQFNVTNLVVEAPYWVTEPTAGQLRNGTNTH